MNYRQQWFRRLVQNMYESNPDRGFDSFSLKVLNKEAIIKRNEVRHIMAERNVLIRNLKHPFLVGLHYSFQSNDKLYFVLDYVNGGEVKSFFSLVYNF
jgi:serine/threonine protein kinase